MSENLREAVHEAADQLPENRLADVLHLMELLTELKDDAEVEPEEMWLLASGQLKRLVDETEHAPAPIDDWRKHL